MLTEVALPLRRLDDHARGIHLVADVSQDVLDATAPEDRVVDVVAVRAGESLIATVPGFVIGVLEEDELELGPAESLVAHLVSRRQLLLEDGSRRGGDLARAIEPGQVALDHRGVLLPRRPSQRAQVEVEEHVAIATLPGRHRVAGDGVHLDIDGEQVVAALSAVVEHMVEEETCVQALALEAALHVGEAHDDRVDRTLVDAVAQIIHRQLRSLRGCGLGGLPSLGCLILAHLLSFIPRPVGSADCIWS